MAVHIEGDLENNTIEISERFMTECSGSITLKGKGATIRIGSPILGGSIYSTIDSNASITIGDNCVIGNLTVHAVVPDTHIRIGSGVGFNGSVSLAAHEPSTITVGDECLFASGCHLNSSDVHHIYDSATKERLNPPGDITIGKRVWLGAGVLVMKGVSVGEDSVVGAASVLTAHYPGASLIAGVPGKVIRSGIYWTR